MQAALKMSSQSLRVVEANPRTDPRWESFVVEHPNGSIYHHPAWLEALESEYGQKGVYFVCEDAVGDVLAILPMLYTRGLPLNMGGALTGRRLASLPRTPVAGPLSTDSRATRVLLQEAIERVSRSPGVQLQIKAQGPEFDGLVEGLVGAPWRVSYVLRLPSGLQQPFRIADGRHRGRIKWSVGKALRLGVRVRPAETESELREWYLLYLEAQRRNAVPPRPYRFFSALWNLLRPRGMMELLIATVREGSRTKIIAGSIFLMHGRTVSYAFNGSSVRELSCRPNDAIQWEAINEACRRGFRSFDFGEVPEGHSELAHFKRKWGSEPVQLHRYYFPPQIGSGVAESKGFAASLAESAWSKLPLKATAWLGDRIYGYL